MQVGREQKTKKGKKRRKEGKRLWERKYIEPNENLHKIYTDCSFFAIISKIFLPAEFAH